jgi:hypothetical protein
MTTTAAPVLTLASIVELSTCKGFFIGTLAEACAWQDRMQAAGAAIETADGSYSDIDELDTADAEAVLAFLIENDHTDKLVGVAALADTINRAADEAVAQGGERALCEADVRPMTRELGLPDWHPAVRDVCKTLGLPIFG